MGIMTDKSGAEVDSSVSGDSEKEETGDVENDESKEDDGAPDDVGLSIISKSGLPTISKSDGSKGFAIIQGNDDNMGSAREDDENLQIFSCKGDVPEKGEENQARSSQKDNTEQEVRHQADKVIKLQYVVKRVAGSVEASPTPLVKTRGFSHIVGSGKRFHCDLCPNSGATTNKISEKMVQK